MAKAKKKSAKASSKKPAGRKPAAKGGAKKSAASKPRTLSTGKGASPADLGKKLVTLFNQGKADDWIKTVWDKKVRSIEGDGMYHDGPKAILEKWAWWMSRTEVLGCTAEGPYCGGTGFAVKYAMHVKDKESGQETRMSEVAVYTVKNGKIVQEEFMYGS